MRKLTVNLPALAFIEVDGANIRLDDAKAKCFMSTTAYLKPGLRQLLCTDAQPAPVASHPQIIHPFILRHSNATISSPEIATQADIQFGSPIGT